MQLIYLANRWMTTFWFSIGIGRNELTNIGNIMKIMVLLTVVFTLQASADALGQRVTLEANNQSLQSVLKDLRQQSGYSFIYSDEDLKLARNITLQIKNKEVLEVLPIVFKDQPLDYKVKGKIISIKSLTGSSTSINKSQSSVQQAQRSIRGYVTNEKGEPLAGATVRLKGNNNVVQTNQNGEFYFSNIDPNQTLVVSFLGYETKEVKSTDAIRIKLKSSGLQINDVEIMVGYGKVKKKDLTGSVSSISEKDIEYSPAATVDNVLMGRASGVQVTRADGQPGGSMRVQIRGAASITGDNEPLYVIDGVPIMPEAPYINNKGNNLTGGEVANGFERGISPISNLNIDDILSIDILKDASAAAIYGSRAANGVVIITTKSGKVSENANLTLNAYTGLNVSGKPNLLSAEKFKEITREAALNNPNHATSVQILSETVDYFKDSNTDWVSQIRRNAASSNLNASIGGGNNASRYYTSLSIMNQDGTEINSDFKRFAGKTNLDFSVNKRLRVGTNLNYNYSKSNVSMGLSRIAYQFRPDFPIYNEDGSYFTSPDRVTVNPVAMSTATNVGKTYGFIGTAFGEFEITPKILFKSSISYGITSYVQEQFTPRYIKVSNENPNETGTGSRGYRTSDYNIWENTLTYNEKLNDHHSLNVLIGNSFQENRMNYNLAVGTGFPDDFVLNNLGSAALPYDVQGYKSANGLVSYFARSNYSYKSKYLLTLTGRIDGSSKFSEQYQYGFFPSGAVAWRISEEKFLKEKNWIDDFKVRFSLGKTGKQNIGDYLWRGLYESTKYANEGGSYPSTIRNDQVKWEETHQLDLGIDFSFLNGKLYGSVGKYSKITDGLLITTDMPSSSGYDRVVANIGKTSNKGWEIDLNSDLVAKKDLTWSIGLTLAKNENKVIKIGGEAFSNPSQRGMLNDAVVMEGQRLGTFYGYKVEGIFQYQEEIDALNESAPNKVYQSVNTAPGDFKYIDVNGDGFINDLDRDVIGNANPDFYGGFYTSFKYKNFGISTRFNYSIGNQLIWRLDQQQVVFYGDKNFTDHVLDHWSEDNPDSKRPRAVIGDPSNNRRFSDYFVHDASYLKLSSLNLSYQFSKGFFSKWGINDIGLYATGNNLLTITSYPGLDPEANSNPGSIFMGEDRSVYPPARTYTLGIKARF